MSTAGQGSISLQNKQTPSGAPFPAGSANNGLSVDAVTGKIVLGNDLGGNLADLISNREIDQAGFLFQLLNGAGRKFLSDPTNGLYEFGDIDSIANGTFLEINDGLNLTRLFSRGNEYMRIYAALTGQNYIFGDVLAADNGAQLNINDYTNSIILGNTLKGQTVTLSMDTNEYIFGPLASGNADNLVIDDAAQRITLNNNGNQYLTLDIANHLYSIGDLSNALNNSKILIDDANQVISAEFGATLQQQLYIDPLNQTYWLGDIPNGVNSTYMYLDPTLFEVSCANNVYLAANVATGSYVFGDFDNANNGALIQIQDNTNTFRIDNAAHNMGLTINGNPGFTGTVTPVNSITVEGGIVTNVT